MIVSARLTPSPQACDGRAPGADERCPKMSGAGRCLLLARAPARGRGDRRQAYHLPGLRRWRHDAGSFRIRTRRTSPVPTDPRRCCCRKRWHANIACDAEFDIDSEQPGDLVGVCSFAYAGEKLLCDAGVLFLAHDLFSM
jgi:hypothetical protein